jgi:uncharacterized repeat protein (TIGR03803 family)
MMDRNELRGSILISRSQLSITLLLTLLLGPLIVAAQEPASGHFRVIHSFTGGKDGAYPYAGLIMDQSGSLYGTANAGGRGTCPPANIGCGTVFKLVRSKSGWVFQVVYAFLGGNDGQGPYGRVAIGPGGSLYGTTIEGGDSTCLSGCGTVFSLKPPATCQTKFCPSMETVLYRFKGNSDGFYPTGDLAFDAAGNLYGTTTQGGSVGPGTVYELKVSKGSWTESILWNLTGGEDGGNPYSGVILDGAGNIFSTTLDGGTNNSGSVFKLTHSGSGWSETTLHDFYGSSHGIFPQAGLILEKSGNLIGATSAGGLRGGGTVYSLAPAKGGWRLSTLYNFPGRGQPGPWAQLTMDAAGNLYGTTQGYPPAGDHGTVFKLTHTSSGWQETLLHRFTGGSDGQVPYSTLVLDSSGHIYGTALLGGKSNYGVVFEITP